jgi:predicted nucleic acid-binding protein
MASSRRTLLLMDANVLIDFCDSDPTIIPLISKHIGRVHVPLPILVEEVEQFNDLDWTELEIVGVEPSLEVVTRAAQRRAGLSFHDHLCLLLARDNGWTCVTNDGRLRRECAAEGIATLWGLEVVALLVEDSVLSVSAAEDIGKAIQAANPKFITMQILHRFLMRVGAAGPRTKR